MRNVPEQLSDVPREHRFCRSGSAPTCLPSRHLSIKPFLSFLKVCFYCRFCIFLIFSGF